MEPRDVKTLLLLEAIDKEECQSQRELSKKLNMSLGLVNAFIKDLKSRGIFLTSSQSNNNRKYILSQKGIVKKANLAKQYLSYSIRYYNEIKRWISELLAALEKDGKQSIVFYGTGELCEITCIIIYEKNLNNVKILDNKKAGKTICGLKIHEEAQIEKLNFDAVVIMDFENSSLIRRKLIDKSVPPHKIFTVFNQQSIF